MNPQESSPKKNDQQPSTAQSRHVAWYIGALLFVAIAVSAFYYIRFYYYSPEFVDTQDKVTLRNLYDIINPMSDKLDIPTSDSFKDFAGEETGTKYQHLREELTAMEDDLKKSEGTISETELLYKKAIYYKKLASTAMIAESDKAKREKMIVDAFNGLYEGIYRIPEASKKDNRNPTYLRRLYVYTITYIYRAVNPELFAASYFTHDTMYFQSLGKYPNKDVASVIYILDNLYSMSDLPRDNYMVSERMYHLARLLGYKEVTDDVVLRSRIFSEFTNLKDIFPTASTSQLTSSKQENEVRPLANFALSLAIASRLGAPVTFDEAEQALKAANASLQKNLRSEEDNLLHLKLYMDVNRAALLYDANGRTMNDEIIAILRDIEQLVTSFKGIDGMYRPFTNYLLTAQRPTYAWNVALKDLLEMSEKDAQFKAFLISIGLKL